jgi:hypothetical protein
MRFVSHEENRFHRLFIPMNRQLSALDSKVWIHQWKEEAMEDLEK